MKTLILSAAVALIAVGSFTSPGVAEEGCPRCKPACPPKHGNTPQAWRYNLAQPWNCDYYHTQWGTPVALVVPPTAEKYREMGWGVGNTRTRRIYYQFGRQYPGEISDDGPAPRGTPQWPSDTTQFGVYYVRGPW